jgi:EAL domain-containing protein (putative c-di-GMP-specific phosphodiesterase class I)
VPTNLLDKILAPGAISTVFQPIYKIDSKGLVPVMLECLSRGPASTNAVHAGVLFEYAQLKAAEPLVDRACMSAALETVAQIKQAERFSLNIFAATLVRDAAFVRWIAETLNRLHLDPSNLVFELVEHGEAWDTQAFLAALRDLRALGSEIALDDVGLAHSNFQRILDCDPEYLKLDRCIVSNCHLDWRRQALLRSLEHLSKDLGSSLIAEGVETYNELNTLRSHGIALFQGFLLSKPTPAAEISDLLEAVRVPRKPSMSVSDLSPVKRNPISARLARSEETI